MEICKQKRDGNAPPTEGIGDMQAAKHFLISFECFEFNFIKIGILYHIAAIGTLGKLVEKIK